MTTSSVWARLAVVVALLTLACAPSAGSHPLLAGTQPTPQSPAPQLTESVPSNGADLTAWPEQATLTFNEAVTCASVTLTGPQGSIETGQVTASGPTCSVPMPARQPAGRYVLTYTARNGAKATTGSLAFAVTSSQDVLGAPSETGTADSGLGWVVVGVSVLGGALLFGVITKRRAVTKRRSGLKKNPDHL